MGAKKFKRLSLQERIIIETLLKEKKSKAYISNFLGRCRSTIGNEINAWVGSAFFYKAEIIHELTSCLNTTKHDKDKITLCNSLKIQVFRGLLSKLSPELISGRLKLSYPNNPAMNISHESIYRYIYSHPQGGLNRKLITLLVRHKPRRKMGKKREGHLARIKEGNSIESRPSEVESRIEVGHWEGDLMIGPKQNSCLGSIVERKSRYTILVKLDNKKSKTVCQSFSKKLSKLPLLYRKTMTYDNGTEMAEHKLITAQTGMDIYFAHPYSSWERGTNENTNGIVRRYYPKNTDFNRVKDAEIYKLQEHLNNRPRKVLGYYTPNEIYQFEIRKNNKSDNDDLVLEMGNKSFSDLFSFLIPQLE
jgi:IS30 family transposase